ncbi:hypothetical protein EVAR_78512_1 [Eumeta japonica]|uniref:Uncharacterized protein n=1 Tax=Eumeta variegata TaxID=151549 RepID=A0A4C1TYA8_EUMVA|nr:hypothetical protein EVAR_78512_1 [Eumeta japonica]
MHRARSTRCADATRHCYLGCVSLLRERVTRDFRRQDKRNYTHHGSVRASRPRRRPTAIASRNDAFFEVDIGDESAVRPSAGAGRRPAAVSANTFSVGSIKLHYSIGSDPKKEPIRQVAASSPRRRTALDERRENARGTRRRPRHIELSNCP